MVTRAIARKLNIETIIQAPYIAGGSIENPNHITLGTEKVTRVNTIGIIEDKYENPEANFSSFIIKYNNSQIKVKFFEKTNLDDFQKGDLIKVIGKIRESNEEKFILGEIIKNQKSGYEKIREQELFKIEKTTQPIQEKQETTKKPVIEELGNVSE